MSDPLTVARELLNQPTVYEYLAFAEMKAPIIAQSLIDAAAEVERIKGENAALVLSLGGRDKALAILNASMESTCAEQSRLKQELRKSQDENAALQRDNDRLSNIVTDHGNKLHEWAAETKCSYPGKAAERIAALEAENAALRAQAGDPIRVGPETLTGG